jgi:hypothetical protein
MNTRLQQNLASARFDLAAAQLMLAKVRCGEEIITGLKLGDPRSPIFLTEETAIKTVYRALDRAWEAQCMAEGVFG